VSLKTGSGRITVQTNRPFPQTQIKFLSRTKPPTRTAKTEWLIALGKLGRGGGGRQLKAREHICVFTLTSGQWETFGAVRNGAMAQRINQSATANNIIKVAFLLVIQHKQKS
jgi:hypothetical protein